MANESSIGYGLRPIGKVGQNNDKQGLSEYSIAANASAIFQNDPVSALATGTIGVAGVGSTLVGSLNGIFYTDSANQKPTWANHLAASNAATDIVGFVSDDPYERFEIRSAGTVTQASVFLVGDISYVAGVSPNFVSRVKLAATLTSGASAQLRVVGISKDPKNSDTAAVNPSVVCVINEHLYSGTGNGI
jgi:hypothetical protein